MKQITVRINRYKRSSLYREHINNNLMALALLLIVLAYGLVSTLALKG